MYLHLLFFQITNFSYINYYIVRLVALFYLRHPAVHLAGFDFTLHQLLLLAIATDKVKKTKNVISLKMLSSTLRVA